MLLSTVRSINGPTWHASG